MQSPDKTADISPQMAEQYTGLLDLLQEIDLTALDAQIARLVRLRDTIRKVQGMAPEDPPVPPVPPNVPLPPGRTPNRSQFGTCRRMCEIALGTGPKTVREIMQGVNDDTSTGYQRIYNSLKDLMRSGAVRKVPDTEPIRYELVPRDTEPRTPLTAVV